MAGVKLPESADTTRLQVQLELAALSRFLDMANEAGTFTQPTYDKFELKIRVYS